MFIVSFDQETFDVNNMRGCLDQFINCQQQDLKKYGKSLITEEGLAGLMLDIIFAGEYQNINNYM